MWFTFWSYLRHWLKAGDAHAIHSPFVFTLYTQALIKKNLPFQLKANQLRQELRNSKEVLEVQDFGAGSKVFKSPIRPVAALAAHTLKQPKEVAALWHCFHHLKAATILELGTSLGLSLWHWRQLPAVGKIVSLEGCPQTTRFAQRFQENHPEGSSAYTIVEGRIEDTLATVLKDLPRLDVVIIDAHHQRKALCDYFETCLPALHNDSVVVVDDLYWSADMQAGWKQLQQHPAVRQSIDAYSFGLLFFRAQQEKEHFRLRL